MRVSTVQLQRIVMSGMEQGASSFSHISQQQASGKRIIKPSDDPLGTVKLMALQAEQANLKQFNTNIENARRHLSGAETYVTSISAQLGKLRDLTLEAGNGTLTPAGRKAIAQEMEAVKESLLASSNAKGSNGKYLFSGSEVEKSPIAGPDPVTGDYTYAGDNRERKITIASGVKVVSNIDVEVTFTPTTPPNCDSTLTTPANGDIAAPTDGVLVWSAALGGATGYNLTVGTTSGGNDVLATTALGNVTTYNLGALAPTTSYFVTIEAFNGNGTATGCTEQTFTTRRRG